MPIITFWSDNEKTIGQTVSTAVAATVMAMEYNYKVLLISADFNNDTLENCFGFQESNKEIIKDLIKVPQVNLDSGIKGLLKLADSNHITPDVIHDYTKIIFKNRLEVLYSPMNVTESEKKQLFEKIKTIIINASRYYDYVLIDLKKGQKYAEQIEILEMSDVIVLNVNQEIKKIERLITFNDLKKMTNKSVWNICRYDKKSKYNVKNITRNLLKRQYVYDTAYNTLVLEATQEGKLVELLLRFKTLKDEDENLLFISNIKKLVEGILLKYQHTRMKI